MEVRLLQLLEAGALSKAEMSQRLGQKSVSGPLNHLVRTLLRSGKVAYTLPDKPNSRLQKYKLSNGQDT
jgi:ATP-dependent DNA helicase RecG